MKIMKKMLCLIVAVAMILSTMSITVFADEAVGNVAKVGNTEYATIDEAIANWTNNTTLTLLADVTLSNVIKLSSTEYHILDLGTYTMTAAKNKDAIQYEINGRSTAGYALDIKADATNPGGITATGNTIVSHTKPLFSAPSKDRPITRFYGGVFNAAYVVKQGGTFGGSGYTGASAPYFQFYGGVYNGTIYTNRSQNQFHGGTFNGSMQMSVDSSAYTLIAGGTFKNLSNLMGSELNSDKFTIGSSKGANNGSVCIDENGNYVITTTTPADAEASVASNYNNNNYFYYSTVNTNGMYYEDVYDALEGNKTGTVTVFTDEIDLADSSFAGTIVVPEGKEITIIVEEGTTTPQWSVSTSDDTAVTYKDDAGNALEKDENGSLVVVTPVYVATINGKGYENFTDALADALAMSGDVTVEIYDKVTLKQNLSGNYSSINFVGKDAAAEIYIDLQGYVEAPGKNVSFEDLILSKSAGGYIDNAGFMNLAFGVYEATNVSYTKCTFKNGAYASKGTNIFTGCTFYRSHDRYGLWAYGSDDIVVDGCTFNDIRGIKMFDENKGANNITVLTVKNTDFSAVTDKPAIVLTYGKSVTLENNTYSAKGVFELDLDGTPNGTPVTSDKPEEITCVNDNGVCGVLIDGKIYTTVAQAAKVAIEDSTVILLHDSKETVEFIEGVELDKNGFEAAGVTVAKTSLVAKIGDVEYADLQTAINNATLGAEIDVIDNISLTQSVVIEKGKSVILDLNGYTVSSIIDTAGSDALIVNKGSLTVKDSAQNGKLTVDVTNPDMQDTPGYASNTITNYGTFVLESGTIENYGEGDACYPIDNNSTIGDATVTINGGKVLATSYAVRQFANGANENTVTINGGELSGYRAVWMHLPGSDANVKPDANLIITNGTLTSTDTTYNSAIYVRTYGQSYENTDITISGGTFNGDIALTGPSSQNYAVTENVSVTGGTFNGANGIYSYSDSMTGVVSGGTFKAQIDSALIKEGFVLEQNENGTYGVVEKLATLAKIGDVEYESVAAALEAAKEAGIKDLTITLIGETTKESSLALEDSFDLIYRTAFDNVTFKQEDPSKVYYIDTIYTGDRTSSDGKFVFDGVNIMITSQIWFECDVVLKNNSIVERYKDTKNFIYYGNVTIEPGSVFKSEIDDIFAGSVTVDGGKEDGTYTEVPGYHSIYFDVRSGHSLILKNGAYAKFNAANEVGRLTLLDGNAFVHDSKLEVFNNIVMGANALLDTDCASTILAKVITGAGVISIDATNFDGNDVQIITADMSGFTGIISVTGNDNATYKITDEGVVITTKPVAKIGETEYKTLEEALNAAVDGDIVTLLDDITMSAKTINVTRSITIDGNGFKLIQPEAETTNHALIYVDGDSTLDVTIKNVVFDGFKGSAIRTLEANITIDNCEFKNGVHTGNQGVVRLNYGNAVVKNSTFTNNKGTMMVSFDYDVPSSVVVTDTLLVENCTFEGNECTETAVVYYADGIECTITNSKFKSNSVVSGGNGATIYLGFMENCTVTNCLFEKNNVEVTGTSTRVSGGIFFGCDAVVENNVFVNNTAKNANNDALGADVSTSVYYGNIDLGKNYWGGNEPQEGVNYFVNHKDSTVDTKGELALDTYYKEYSVDESGNVVLSDLVEIKDIFGNFAFFVRNMDSVFEDTYRIALFAGIDSLKYQEVGFKMFYDDFETLITQRSTKDVYTSITAGNMTIEADEYDVYRIFGIAIDLVTAWDDYNIIFQPYAVDLEGNEIPGQYYMIDDIYTLSE